MLGVCSTFTRRSLLARERLELRLPPPPTCWNLKRAIVRVSIITVSFNSAQTIGDTLASVARQTHPDIEHLIVDGASVDDTMEVVRRQGTSVTRSVSEPDGGIYYAMNKGVALATGDLVGFLNADDVFAGPDSVAELVAEAHRTQAQAVYGDLMYVRADDLSAVVRVWRSGCFTPTRLRYGWMPPHPTFYVRAETMRELGGFDTRYRIAADYEFMLRCLTGPGRSVGYVPRVLVHMRTGGASNQSLAALWRKSVEDLQALSSSGVGAVGTLLCKNVRKLPQFFRRKDGA
jgi:glycosyltransferase